MPPSRGSSTSPRPLRAADYPTNHSPRGKAAVANDQANLPLILPSSLSLSICPACPRSTLPPSSIHSPPTCIHPSASLTAPGANESRGAEGRRADINLGQTELGCVNYISLSLLLIFLPACLPVCLCVSLSLSKIC